LEECLGLGGGRGGSALLPASWPEVRLMACGGGTGDDDHGRFFLQGELAID